MSTELKRPIEETEHEPKKKVKQRPKVFFHFDIEADGDAPGCNSMRSIGIVVFDEDGNEIKGQFGTFQYNFEPLPGAVVDPRCKTEFWDKNPEAWEFVNVSKCDPAWVMFKLESFYHEYASRYEIEWVADPAAYDWQWVKYYYTKFRTNKFSQAEMADIGFSATCQDTFEQIYWKLKGITNKDEKHTIKDAMAGDAKHTHNPVDDARRAARIYHAMHKNLEIKP